MTAAKPRKTIEDKDRKLAETPDLVTGAGRSATKYKMDLIPPSLVVARYFADAQARVDEINAQAEEAARAIEEYTDEHTVEGGLLSEAVDDDKVTKALATARLKDAKRGGSDPDEIKALQHLIDLYDTEGTARRTAKEAQAALDLATLKKYGELAEADIEQLVLDDKWSASIASRIAGEGTALTLALVNRIQQLGERYADTLTALDAELAELEAKVAEHLADMGVK